MNIFTNILNRRRIKIAQSAIFSSMFVTDNHLTTHTKCAILNLHRFKTVMEQSFED